MVRKESPVHINPIKLGNKEKNIRKREIIFNTKQKNNGMPQPRFEVERVTEQVKRKRQIYEKNDFTFIPFTVNALP